MNISKSCFWLLHFHQIFAVPAQNPGQIMTLVPLPQISGDRLSHVCSQVVSTYMSFFSPVDQPISMLKFSFNLRHRLELNTRHASLHQSVDEAGATVTIEETTNCNFRSMLLHPQLRVQRPTEHPGYAQLMQAGWLPFQRCESNSILQSSGN